VLSEDYFPKKGVILSVAKNPRDMGMAKQQAAFLQKT
jgi:hypothetical protein